MGFWAFIQGNKWVTGVRNGRFKKTDVFYSPDKNATRLPKWMRCENKMKAGVPESKSARGKYLSGCGRGSGSSLRSLRTEKRHHWKAEWGLRVRRYKHQSVAWAGRGEAILYAERHGRKVEHPGMSWWCRGDEGSDGDDEIQPELEE